MLFLFLITVLAPVSLAQVRFGVDWTPPEDERAAVNQLFLFQKLGVTELRVEGLPDMGKMDILEGFDFNVHMAVPNQFLLANELRQKREQIFNQYIDYHLYLKNYQQVTSIELFQYGSLEDPAFGTLFQQNLERISTLLARPSTALVGPVESATPTGVGSYLIAVRDAEGVMARHQLPVIGFYYLPEGDDPYHPSDFRRMLDFLKVRPQYSLFLNYSWLVKRLQEDADFARVLQLYAGNRDATFPVDAAAKEGAPTQAPGTSWIVFFLVVLWGTVSVHFNYAPNYRKSLFRYFTTHAFFVIDVVEWRIRSNSPSLIILAQHAFAGGILLQLLANTFMTDLGWQALVHHYPWLQFLYFSKRLILIYATVSIFLLEMLVTFWMLWFNRTMEHLAQVIHLYAWPLQVNLVLVTLIFIFVQTGISAQAIGITTALVVLTAFYAYYQAIFDLMGFTRERKWSFVAITAGLFTVILIVLIVLLVQTSVLDVFDMALRL